MDSILDNSTVGHDMTRSRYWLNSDMPHTMNASCFSEGFDEEGEADNNAGEPKEGSKSTERARMAINVDSIEENTDHWI